MLPEGHIRKIALRPPEDLYVAGVELAASTSPAGALFFAQTPVCTE